MKSSEPGSTSESDAPAGERPASRAMPGGLDQLYKEVILDHYRSPRNKGELEGATHSVTMNNPLCGDVVELDLHVERDRIRDVSFDGRGCSISQAAASMLTQTLQGKSLDEARELSRKFTRLMHGDEELARDEELGDLRSLSGVAKFPVRIKCALLGFNCLDELIGDGEGGEHAGT